MEKVAPFAGAWIEMRPLYKQLRSYKSLPSRERGLKLIILLSFLAQLTVAPFAGAWIEMGIERGQKKAVNGRSLRGSVD